MLTRLINLVIDLIGQQHLNFFYTIIVLVNMLDFFILFNFFILNISSLVN